MTSKKEILAMAKECDLLTGNGSPYFAEQPKLFAFFALAYAAGQQEIDSLRQQLAECEREREGLKAKAAVLGLLKVFSKMSREQFIRRAVDRFLSWKLPNDFHPDCGIDFKPLGKPHPEALWEPWPVGTNLFTADQARAMFEDCIQEREVIMPQVEKQLASVTKERDELIAQKFSEEPLRRQIAELRELGRFREKHFLTGSPEVYDDPSAAFHKFACEMHDALKLATVTKERDELVEALKQFAECDLNDGNCASLEVAMRRIRSLAQAALAKLGADKTEETK